MCTVVRACVVCVCMCVQRMKKTVGKKAFETRAKKCLLEFSRFRPTDRPTDDEERHSVINPFDDDKSFDSTTVRRYVVCDDCLVLV